MALPISSPLRIRLRIHLPNQQVQEVTLYAEGGVRSSDGELEFDVRGPLPSSVDADFYRHRSNLLEQQLTDEQRTSASSQATVHELVQQQIRLEAEVKSLKQQTENLEGILGDLTDASQPYEPKGLASYRYGMRRGLQNAAAVATPENRDRIIQLVDELDQLVGNQLSIPAQHGFARRWAQGLLDSVEGIPERVRAFLRSLSGGYVQPLNEQD